MSMHFAELELTITAMNASGDYSDVIKKAFMGSRMETVGSFNGEISLGTHAGEVKWDEELYFNISYNDFPYYNGNEIEEYLKLLAAELPYSSFSLDGYINNSGSAGDYVDRVFARYSNGVLQYRYYNGFNGSDKIDLDLPTLHRLSKNPEFDPDLAKSMGSFFAEEFIIEEGVLLEYKGPGGSVIVPEGVISINDSVFSGYQNNDTFLVRGSLRFFSNYRHRYCMSLSSVKLSDGIKNIGIAAFSGCSSLSDIILPNGVTSINDRAFEGCTALKEITIPNSVASIGNGVFEGCTSLQSIIIPDSVKSIGENAFKNCTNLASITLSSNLNSINNCVFKGCTSLTSITIPNGVTSIGGHAFEDCTGLMAIAIPDGVTSIGCCAFEGTGLTLISLPDTVKSIGLGVSYGYPGVTGLTAFSGCKKLRNVTIPPSVLDECVSCSAKDLRLYYLTDDFWPVLDSLQQAEFFLKRYRDSFAESFKSCVPDEQVDSLGKAILTKLQQEEVSGKECTAAAGFVILYSTKAQVNILKSIYLELKSKKAGKKAVVIIEENSELKASILGA